ncbi:MAG: NAD(P)-binding domain-containing protein [Oligoflexales bacterium]|nr:NAD(P)-binding domain-containing protein [Oligoflexales bacterium]
MGNKTIGVLGSGIVGQTLAEGFISHGYEVMRGSRDPNKLEDWLVKYREKADIGTFEETAKFGDILVLAVKGSVAQAVVELCGLKNLQGKTIIDATNPIAEIPPQNGVINFFTDHNHSLMEHLQESAPDAHFVKAFSCVGNAHMVNPQFGSEKPSMFICGNEQAAKDEVSGILDKFGWETCDMGMVESARAIEPLCMLWCIRGFLYDKWDHAFRLLSK